jgi:predicted nucleic acid-binding protein
VKPFVLDCSVTMAWCFEDECDAYADAVLGALGRGDALVPAIWPLEVANVLLVAERTKRLKKADSARFVELVRGLPVVVESFAGDTVLDRVIGLGREFGLSSYDASYLELAMRQGLPLATRDKALARACKKAGVPLLDPDSSA